MADRSGYAVPEQPSAKVGRALLPSLLMMLCVGVAFALVAWPGAPWALSRAVSITALTALALLAVGVSLFWSMGLRQERYPVRLMILVPLAISLLLTVALMLDTHFRGPGLAGRG